jgi:hypothetical protein
MNNLEWCLKKLNEVAQDLREPQRGALLEHQAAKLDEVREKLKAYGWQPIESAPKDGTVILVPGGIGYWKPSAEQWYTITGEAWPGRPIRWPVNHWMPQPGHPDITPNVHGGGTGED